MELDVAALIALFSGASGVLPVSSRGHWALVSATLGEPIDARLAFPVALGTALALVVASRDRLRELGRGVAPLVVSAIRLRASPRAGDVVGFVVAAALGLAGALLLGDASKELARSPLAEAVGMVATATMLLSTAAAPSRSRAHLGVEQTLALAIATSLAALPGGSPIGAAFASLVWTGMQRRHAVGWAFVVATPHLMFSSLRAIGAREIEASLAHPLQAALLATITLGGGLVAATIFRRVAERRIGAIASLELALGVALFAYAWALTGRAA